MASLLTSTSSSYTSYKFYPRFSTASSQYNVKKRDSRDKPGDLIAFLAISHQRSLDLAFIRWDEAQLSLGVGATAQVDQLTLTAKASLAFKRAKESSIKNVISDEYRVLISEVYVLTHPSTRYHPHIITLEAVSWEFHPESGECWPVLLFEKAQHGDFLSFLSSEKGQALSFQQRLRLCKDVALALTSLHRFGIIHGDINPRNILVFEDEGNFLAKLSDFGYAALMLHDETINLATTWPWAAPETGFTWEYSFPSAQKADIYSFGVVCLWALLSPEANDNISEPHNYSPFSTKWIETLRRDNSIAENAIAMAKSIPLIDEIRRKGLQSFFQFCLSADPDQRDLDLKGLFQDDSMGADFGSPATEFSIPNDVPYAALFGLERILHMVLEGDFRLWYKVVDALVLHASDSTHAACQRNAALQLSVCFKLGFGCKQSDQISNEYLKQSESTESDLEDILSFICADQGPYHTGMMAETPSRVQASAYERDHILDEAYQAHLCMKTNLEVLVEQKHSGVITQTVILADILHLQRRWYEEENLLLEALSNVCAGSEIEKYGVRQMLLHLYYEVGDWSKMMDIASELYQPLQPGKARSNMVYQSSANLDEERYLECLIVALYHQEEWTRVVDACVQRLELAKRIYGNESREFISTSATLATVYMTLERYDKGKKLHEQTLEMAERNFGPKAEYVIWVRSLGVDCSYRTRSGTKAARISATGILQDCKDFLGPNNNLTIDMEYVLGCIYLAQGWIAEALPLTERSLEVSRSYNGYDHLCTARLTNLLAVLYGKVIRWEEAETLQTEAIRVFSATVGDMDPFTIAARARLASSQRSRRFYWYVSFVVPEALIISAARFINSLQDYSVRLLHYFA